MGIREQFTRFFSGQSTQVQRPGLAAEDQGASPEREAGQREAHRLAGMSAEDREWEQATLHRHRDREAARANA